MYATLLNGEIDRYPLALPQVRLAFPDVSFAATPDPQDLLPLGIVVVRETAAPEYDSATQVIEEAPPRYENGHWVQAWVVRDLTAEELQARVPRSVTALQGMRAIKAAGLAPGFLAWKNMLDPIDDFEAIAFLDKAQTWEYDDPTLSAALETLGVAQQKNSLFILASTL